MKEVNYKFLRRREAKTFVTFLSNSFSDVLPKLTVSYRKKERVSNTRSEFKVFMLQIIQCQKYLQILFPERDLQPEYKKDVF